MRRALTVKREKPEVKPTNDQREEHEVAQPDLQNPANLECRHRLERRSQEVPDQDTKSDMERIL